MKEKERLKWGLFALITGVFTAQITGYFAAKNSHSYDMTTEVLETEGLLNSSEEGLEVLCKGSKFLSEDLEKQGFLKNFYHGDYGVQKALRDYVSINCKK